jgi:hypothetical protein
LRQLLRNIVGYPVRIPPLNGINELAVYRYSEMEVVPAGKAG